MTAISKSIRGRKIKRLSVVSAVSGPVAFMHPDDIGKLFVPGSKRAGAHHVIAAAISTSDSFRPCPSA